MKCPYCGTSEDKVVDSRSAKGGKNIRRRRECLKCDRRFTTYEHIEEISLMVIKRDNRREPFDRNKVLAGLVKACEKRPISMQKLERMVDNIERQVQKNFESEIESSVIGELAMKHLHNLDLVLCC